MKCSARYLYYIKITIVIYFVETQFQFNTIYLQFDRYRVINLLQDIFNIGSNWSSIFYVSMVCSDRFYGRISMPWDLGCWKSSPSLKKKLPPFYLWIVWGKDEKTRVGFFFGWFSHMQETIWEWNVQKLEDGGS